jgi:biopolymer transport protein ExbD
MTSLVDVIFLLLLFFMLTSSFSKVSELPFAVNGSGGTSGTHSPLFIQLGPDTLSLNGDALDLGGIPGSALARTPAGTPVLISLKGAVNAQRLTDLLVALRPWPSLNVSVLGG